MNPEFRNIFPVSSRGFSGRVPVGIVPSPIGYFNIGWKGRETVLVPEFGELFVTFLDGLRFSKASLNTSNKS
jgi:hypothetical protein